jgi:hypothetical protein
MWRFPSFPSVRSARTVAASAVALSAFAVLTALVACSFIVTGTLPAGYTCQPDAGAGPLCPSNQVCAPNGVGIQFTCVDKCTPTSPSQCQPGYWCDSVGWCVSDAGPRDGSADEGAVEASAEDASDAGDAGADTGAHAACATLGCRCTVTADCPTGLACANEAAATPTIWNAWVDSGVGAGDGTGSGICMEPCCKSSDCDLGDSGAGGYVCFATGGGASLCVAPDWLGDRADIGANAGGAACGGDAGGCRSGLCSAGLCADTCCSSRTPTIDCTVGSNCALGTFPGGPLDVHEAPHCVSAAGGGVGTGGASGTSCRMNSDCRSNLCLGGGGSATCRDACRNALDCSPTGARSTTLACSYIQPVQGSQDIVAACTPIGPNQGPDAGGPSVCFTNDDCQQNHPCSPQPMQVGGATYSVLACAP